MGITADQFGMIGCAVSGFETPTPVNPFDAGNKTRAIGSVAPSLQGQRQAKHGDRSGFDPEGYAGKQGGDAG